MEGDCGTCGVDTEMYASPGLKPPLIRMKIAVIPEAASGHTAEGAESAMPRGGDGVHHVDVDCTKDGGSDCSVIPLVAASGASAEVGSKGGGSGGVCYTSLMRYLRQYEGVRYLDVSAGGVVIGGMMRDKLIDEVRYLISVLRAGETVEGESVGGPMGCVWRAVNFCLTHLRQATSVSC